MTLASQILELANTGKTSAQIGKQLKCNPAYVRAVFARNGLAISIKEVRTKQIKDKITVLEARLGALRTELSLLELDV